MMKTYCLLMTYSSKLKLISVLDTYWNILYNIHVTASSLIQFCNNLIENIGMYIFVWVY